MSTVGMRDALPPLSGRLDILPLALAPSAGSVNKTADQHPELSRHLHDRILTAIIPAQVEHLSEPELRLHLQRIVDQWAHDDSDSVDYHERENAVTTVVDELRGYGPIGGLFRENGISEILINGPRQVFVERRGQLFKSEVVFRNTEHLSIIIGRLIEGTGRRIDKSSPMLDVRLHDGSRMNVVLNPPALNGPLVSIRRFGVRPLTVDDLLTNESLTQDMLDFLAACVKARINSRSQRTSPARVKLQCVTWFVIRCACAPIGLSSASAEAAKPSTCSRP
jgi:pilus assembly protein CpaF